MNEPTVGKTRGGTAAVRSAEEHGTAPPVSTRAESRIVWIAEDPASKAVLDTARKVAETSTTVLITGESGTGKDLLARLIHELGPRRDAPFLKIDCASLPQELVESELFGHERGAFTGAVERKLGRLEMAGAGTIVLDEVAALSAQTQSKLLRVLEERQFERLGGTETITIEARLIALTNADLARLVSTGHFREDLFFRLSVLTIPVPPLRARPADVLPLAAALLERGARVHARSGASFSEPVKKMLATYSWPGNVRELRNAIERALVFSGGASIIPEDFPESVRAADSEFGGALRSLEDMERELIRATLEATRYKIGKTAEILGISRKTLLDKRKKYGLN